MLEGAIGNWKTLGLGALLGITLFIVVLAVFRRITGRGLVEGFTAGSQATAGYTAQGCFIIKKGIETYEQIAASKQDETSRQAVQVPLDFYTKAYQNLDCDSFIGSLAGGIPTGGVPKLDPTEKQFLEETEGKPRDPAPVSEKGGQPT